MPDKRQLDAVGRFLFEPLIRPKQPHRGWKLLSWDVEQGLQLIAQRGEHLLLVEFEERDDEAPSYAQTARFNVHARRHFESQEPLDPADRRLVDAIVRLVSHRESGLPSFERPTTTRKTVVREIEVDEVLKSEGAGHYYINPYAGCMIGCEFCYVERRADFSRSLEGLPQLPWGRYVDVKVNAPEVLRAEVQGAAPGIVRMSPIVTDPYQSIEKRYRVTRGCLEVLAEANFVPVVLTRATRVLEDLDLLRSFDQAIVGFSIPSDDDRYRQLFEPGGDPIDDRIEALERFAAAGVRTLAVVQPLLPLDPERLVDRLAPHVSAVRVDRMHHVGRYRHLYERAGIPEAASEEFYAPLAERLLTLFRERGVRVDEMDNLAALLE